LNTRWNGFITSYERLEQLELWNAWNLRLA
jgi:hypothetical protein